MLRENVVTFKREIIIIITYFIRDIFVIQPRLETPHHVIILTTLLGRVGFWAKVISRGGLNLKAQVGSTILFPIPIVCISARLHFLFPGGIQTP